MRHRSLLFAITTAALLAAGPLSATAMTSAGGWEVVHSPGGRPAQLSATDFASSDDGWAVGSTGASLDGTGLDTLIEHWDGMRWRVVDSLTTPQSDEVLTGVTATGPNDAWAVGWQDPYGTGRVHALFLHWDGSTWEQVSGAPGAGIARAVDARTAEDIWAVGLGLVEHFDGSAWSVVPAPRADGDLDAVTALSADDVWAVGSRPFTRGGYHHGKPYIAHWDGDRWSGVATPPSITGNLAGVSAADPSDIWAVGTLGSFSQAPYVVHFDGSRWRHVDVPAAPERSGLSGVTALDDGDVWAVGSQDGRLKNGFAVLRTFTEHFDGTRWSVVDSRNDSRHDNWLAASAAIGDAVWAFGADGGTLIQRR